MAEDKVYMPSGIGGLVRYGEEEEQIIKLKPMQVMVFVAVIVAVELLLMFVPLF